MDKELLNRIKTFAEENFCADNPTVTVDNGMFEITNPWIDSSFRWEVSDEEAVRIWGLEVVVDFIIKAMEVVDYD